MEVEAAEAEVGAEEEEEEEAETTALLLPLRPIDEEEEENEFNVRAAFTCWFRARDRWGREETAARRWAQRVGTARPAAGADASVGIASERLRRGAWWSNKDKKWKFSLFKKKKLYRGGLAFLLARRALSAMAPGHALRCASSRSASTSSAMLPPRRQKHVRSASSTPAIPSSSSTSTTRPSRTACLPQ